MNEIKQGVERLREFVNEDWRPDHDMREWVCPHGHHITFLDADYGETGILELMAAAHDQHFITNPPMVFNATNTVNTDQIHSDNRVTAKVEG
jgi:hypothetical protein